MCLIYRFLGRIYRFAHPIYRFSFVTGAWLFLLWLADLGTCGFLRCPPPSSSFDLFLTIVSFHFLWLNPLMLKTKRYFCTSVSFIVFKKQMLQGTGTKLFNPLVAKALKLTIVSTEHQNLPFPFQIKPL